MKTLLLVRHAKTVSAGANQADHGRALLDQGVADARQLAHYLKKKNYRVDAVLVSSAHRTQTTAQILMATLAEHSTELVVSPALYLASEDTLWQAVQSADQAIDTLMIVGHNPGLKTLAARFMPTLTTFYPGQMVRVRFNADTWQAANAQCAQDVKLV